MVRGASAQIRGNLPADAAQIVGRRHEVSEARRLLTQTRLLTLTGIGGVGKTRLAMRVAAEVRRAFPDGVWLVELASLREEDLLARTVGRVLGIRDQPNRLPAEVIEEYLADKRLLLVLDNCEHLVDACCRLVARLLRVAPELRVLATSRESLGAEGEVLFEVPPLRVPEPDVHAVADVKFSEAAQLFEERARAVVLDFSVNPANHRTVARLCRRLDGIPLAIELAAVRLRALSPEQIIERLDDRFVFLTGGYRTAPPRHQTLRATVDWSFALCSAAEQTLWKRLSVFSGGFTLEAAEYVCAGPPIAEHDVVQVLTGLVDKSIVIHEMRDEGSRYRMLETIRQYGHERLVEEGGHRALARRHRDHYLRRALQAEAGWFGPRQREWFDELAAELANFRAALDFCVGDPAEVEAGLDLVTALHGYWTFGGAFGEARHWYDRLLERVPSPGAVRFRALSLGAVFALMQGEIEIAAPLVAECRDHADRSGDDRSRAVADLLSGRLDLLRGDYRSAVTRLEKSCQWYAGHAGEVPGAGHGMNAFLCAFYLALAAAFAGDERAAAFAADCHALVEAADVYAESSMSRWAQGLERWCAGDVEHAVALFRKIIDVDFRYSMAWGVEGLAWAATVGGRHERAARLFGIAESLRRLMGLSLPGFRPYLDTHVECEASVRRALGDRRFEAESGLGREMALDEAIAYAQDAEAASRRSAPSASGEPPRAAPRQPVSPAAPPRSVLTPREQQVAELVAQGLSNKEIATRLVIAQRTAEGHVERILNKLGFTSRAQIAAWFIAASDPP